MPPIIFLTDVQFWSIILACCMMLSDIIIGFVVAIINGDVSSTKMRTGLLHKVLLIILIAICLLIEISIKHAVVLPFDIPTCEVVCGYIVIMELASTLENIAKGYPEITNSALFKIFNLDSKNNEKKE